MLFPSGALHLSSVESQVAFLVHVTAQCKIRLTDRPIGRTRIFELI